MPADSAIVVIPTNKATVYVTALWRGAQYSNLNGLSYGTLSASTYGQLQNQSTENAEVVVIPTNKATVYLSMARQFASYGNVVALYATYGGMNGFTYGQLGVIA